MLLRIVCSTGLVIKFTAFKTAQHVFVLIFHQIFNDGLEVFNGEYIVVAGLLRAEYYPIPIEQCSDVRFSGTTVFCLNVKNEPFVGDVVIIAEQHIRFP